MKKNNEFLKAVLVWICAAGVILALLVPCFSLIWRDRNRTHTRDECRLLADAILKQSDVEQKRIRKNEQFLQTYLSTLNALSGWAYAYGGTDEQELALIHAFTAHPPKGIAVLQDGTYRVLAGTFARPEFDAAAAARESQMPQDAASTSFFTEEGGTAYFSSVLPEAGALVISRLPDIPELAGSGDQELDLIKLAGSLLSDTGIGIAMVRLSDHQVVQVYGNPQLHEGETLDAEPDGSGLLTIGDTRYIAGAAQDEAYRIYAMVPVSEIGTKMVVSPVSLALIFAVLFLLTVLYAWFLRTDYLRGRVEQENPTGRNEPAGTVLLRHVRLVFLLCSCCAALLILLTCALHAVDTSRVWGNRILDDVERYFQADDQNADLLAAYRKEHKLSVLDITRTLMEASDGRQTDQALSDLSSAVERDLYVLDEDGTVLAGSRPEYDFSGIDDPDSYLYALRGVLDGKADHLAVTIPEGETTSLLCWAARFKNSGGVLVSMDSLTQAISFSDFYADYQVPPGLILLVTDLTTGEILSASDPAYTGKDAMRVGLTEEVLKAGFAGDIVLNGKSCFVQTNVDGDRADVIASDLGYLARVYLPVVLGTIAAGLLAVAVMLTLVLRLQKPLWTDLPQRAVHAESREDADAEFYREQDGNLYTDRSAVGRWLDLRMPFQRQSADEKFRTLLCMLFLALLAGAWIIHQHRDAGELMDSAFTYLLQRRWRYGLNIYAVTYALMQFCLIIAVGLILRRLILAAGSRLGNRGETIARLIGSFVAYASVIFAFARSLVFVGVNSTAILASAGIIGLAVSIGAKDLIADILAGIAIVFEGVFRTGDIVEIGGYRGTVEEVGIRTTKVMSMQNVKVFRNSNISGVINMTQRYSFAQVSLDVSRTQPLEKVEAVFRDALPEIRSRIPGTVSDIELVGIDQLNAKGMVLLFQTKCREADRIRVERQLRRELVLVMEREGMTAVQAASSS